MRSLLVLTWCSVVLGGLVVGCEHLNFNRGEQAPEKPPSCFSDGKSLEQKKFRVEPELARRVQTTLQGVLHLEQTGEKLDERLTSLCQALLQELGSPPEAPSPPNEGAADSAPRPQPPKDESVAVASAPRDSAGEATAACGAAAERLRLFKERLNVALSVETQPFTCGVRLDDYAACARRCDATLPAGQLDVRCDEEQQRGRCSGKCSGTCARVNASDCAASCQGECGGACNKGFHGKCGGKCVGTCDMANVNGKCTGTCDGACLSEAAGTCEGKCTGKCTGACLAASKMKSCDGTCRGTCDVNMAAAVCSQVYPPAELSGECVAACSAELTDKLQCTTDHVAVSVIHADKDSDGLKLRNVVRSRLREVLEIGDGMKAPLDSSAVRLAEALDTLAGEVQASAGADEVVGACVAEAKERTSNVSARFQSLSEASNELLSAIR